MHVGIALYGAARVVIGQPLVEVSFNTSSVSLGQVLERLIAIYPRARPYLLDTSGNLPSSIRVLINNIRPEPDATYDTILHNEDRIALLVAVAGGAGCHLPTKAVSADPKVDAGVPLREIFTNERTSENHTLHHQLREGTRVSP